MIFTRRQSGIDFLVQKTALASAIVTNPPFKYAEAFLRHAANLGIEYVIFLHKVDWLNAADRGIMIETVWCPARCYLLQWRPDFKDQGADNELQLVCPRALLDEGQNLDLEHSVEAAERAAAHAAAARSRKLTS